MILNRQSEVRVDVRDARLFAGRVRKELRLGPTRFDVCFVSDSAMAGLNRTYRGKRRATDVLSFVWRDGGNDGPLPQAPEFRDFLGDVVISPRTARLNARAAGHSLRTEIRWLIIHGVLHLLGYDHEVDGGEMTARELALRERVLCGEIARAPRQRKRPGDRRKRRGARVSKG